MQAHRTIAAVVVRHAAKAKEVVTVPKFHHCAECAYVGHELIEAHSNLVRVILVLVLVAQVAMIFYREHH